MERISIDRFEEDIAVCERDNLSYIYINKVDLPEGAKSGSILLINDEGVITLDKEEEIRRKRRISDLYRSIVIKED